MVRYYKKSPLKTVVELYTIIHQFHGTNCCVDTTKRRLRQNNLYGRRPDYFDVIDVTQNISYQRLNPKYQLPTVKHGGGNVMVRGCFNRDNVSPIHCIEGVMDRRVYLNITKHVMLPLAKEKITRIWI